MEIIVKTAEQVAGVRFQSVGEPPTCHLAYLDGGAVLVLADGTGGTDYLSLLQVAVYASEDAWQNDHDSPLGYADTVAAVRPEETERVVRDALDSAAAPRGRP